MLARFQAINCSKCSTEKGAHIGTTRSRLRVRTSASIHFFCFVLAFVGALRVLHGIAAVRDWCASAADPHLAAPTIHTQNVTATPRAHALMRWESACGLPRHPPPSWAPPPSTRRAPHWRRCARCRRCWADAPSDSCCRPCARGGCRETQTDKQSQAQKCRKRKNVKEVIVVSIALSSGLPVTVWLVVKHACAAHKTCR